MVSRRRGGIQWCLCSNDCQLERESDLSVMILSELIFYHWQASLPENFHHPSHMPPTVFTFLR